jgi:UDP-N-acetylmuramate--alanine ligase
MIAVVTNIDLDHMETYGGDVGKLQDTFIEFVHHLPFYGLAVLCSDDSGVQAALPHISKPVRSYGIGPGADVRAVNVRQTGLMSHFDVVRDGHAEGSLDVTLNLPGLHNVQNALAAIAVASELGVSDAVIQQALKVFKGIGRRFQIHASLERNGREITFVDDYGHHPREVAATLEAARQAWPDRRLVLVFQPHRYTRTRDLFEDFVRVLARADVLVLLDVYPAGETALAGADGRSLSRAIRVRGQVDPIFVEDIAELGEVLAPLVEPGDVVLTSGAGNIGSAAAALPKELMEAWRHGQ